MAARAHDGWRARMQDKLLTPVDDLMWPGYPHNPRVTAAGAVIMFDNQSHGGTLLAFEEKAPIPQRFSRAVEFEVDRAEATLPRCGDPHRMVRRKSSRG